MCAEMDAKNSPIALCQHLEIAARFGRFPNLALRYVGTLSIWLA